MNRAFDTLLQPNVNYVEFVLLRSEVVSDLIYSFDIDKDAFVSNLKGISKKKKIKYFVKKFKRYRINDMIMEVCEEDETRIYKSQNLSSCIVEDKVICLGYSKEKVPVHQFPCTLNIDEVCFIQKLTFRLHNRLFLNFEIQKFMDGQQTYKIYLNYNHDKMAEMENIIEQTTEYITELFNISNL